MKLTINEKDYEIPFDLMLIPLNKFIEWWDAYGKDLDTWLQEIIKIEDEVERIVKLEDYIDEEAICWFSFWTGVELWDAKELPEMQQVLNYYRIFKQNMLKDEEAAKEVSNWHFEWNGENWMIQDWAVTPATKMCFTEIIHGKEIVRQVKKLQESKWVALRYLACVFLRKVDEPFNKAFVYENSERMRLMGTLPLAHAFKIGFFLSACASILTKTFRSFPETETQIVQS